MTGGTDTVDLPAPAARRSFAWSRARVVAVVVTLVLALSCGTLLLAKAAFPSVLPDSWTAADDATRRDAEVTVAARRFALAFLTYDYRTMEKDVDVLKEFAAGAFRDDFDAYEVQLTQLAKTQKSVSTGEVLHVGLASVREDSAVVDVAATKVETSGVAAEGETPGKTTKATRALYLHVTMERVSGAWKVADLEVGRVA